METTWRLISDEMPTGAAKALESLVRAFAKSIDKCKHHSRHCEESFGKLRINSATKQSRPLFGTVIASPFASLRVSELRSQHLHRTACVQCRCDT